MRRFQVNTAGRDFYQLYGMIGFFGGQIKQIDGENIIFECSQLHYSQLDSNFAEAGIEITELPPPKTQQQIIEERFERIERILDHVAEQQAANTAGISELKEQIAANSEQIAANTAGMVELRNLFSDFLRRYEEKPT